MNGEAPNHYAIALGGRPWRDARLSHVKSSLCSVQTRSRSRGEALHFHTTSLAILTSSPILCHGNSWFPFRDFRSRLEVLISAQTAFQSLGARAGTAWKLLRKWRRWSDASGRSLQCAWYNFAPMANLADVLRELREERDRLDAAIAALTSISDNAAISRRNRRSGRRRFSAAAI